MDQPIRRFARDDALTLRRLVLIVLTLGIAGVGFELILLEHMEDNWQWVPLVLLAIAFPASIWLILTPGSSIVRGFQILMGLFVLSGFIGQWLHISGNVEFELEMYPSRKGLELVWEALGGATPALAPGTMIMLGLLGLVACLRHPDLGSAGQIINKRRNHDVSREEQRR